MMFRRECKRLHIMVAKKEEATSISHLNFKVPILHQVGPIGNGLRSIIRTQNGDNIVQNKASIGHINIARAGYNLSTVSILFRLFVSSNIR